MVAYVIGGGVGIHPVLQRDLAGGAAVDLRPKITMKRISGTIDQIVTTRTGFVSIALTLVEKL